MRKSLFVLIAAMTVVTAVPAFAELQNIEVGGSLRIRGNWYSQVDSGASLFVLRGEILEPISSSGGFANVSFDEDDPDAFYIEQRTTLNVKADFTDDVSAFIELDSYSNWGDDNFRRLDAADSEYSGSNQVTRIIPTSSASSGTPVNLYQAYVEMNDSWGAPISVRIGRSEMQHGSEFLVGNQDTSSFFTGLSFDGIWGTYTHDQFNIQAFWTRIAQNANGFGRWEQSGDVDFMGVYGSYTGIEDMVIDAYYYYLNQAATDANGLASKSGLHTLGARFAGNKAQFDWELNGAYQLGDTGALAPIDDFSAFAIQGALGYTFDIEYQPRIFVHGAYYSGDDEDPAFRRLFSDHEYSEFLDGGNLSNIWFVGGGAGAQITESIGLSAVANYYGVVEEVSGTDNGLGVELAVYATYAYSEDLTFSAGYAHFFTMDGIEDAAQPIGNDGRAFIGGGDDGVDYVYLETSISF